MNKDEIRKEVDEANKELMNSLVELTKSVKGNCDNMNRLNSVVDVALKRVERITDTAAVKAAKKALDDVGLGDEHARYEITVIRERHRNRKKLFAKLAGDFWTFVIRALIIIMLSGIIIQQNGIKLSI